MSMSLENVFGPQGLRYRAASSNEVRMFKFPDGVVRAFRFRSSEWELFDLYRSKRMPGFQETLIRGMYDLSYKYRNEANLEDLIQDCARYFFVEHTMLKVLDKAKPSNDQRRPEVPVREQQS